MNLRGGRLLVDVVGGGGTPHVARRRLLESGCLVEMGDTLHLLQAGIVLLGRAA